MLTGQHIVWRRAERAVFILLWVTAFLTLLTPRVTYGMPPGYIAAPRGGYDFAIWLNIVILVTIVIAVLKKKK